MKNVINTDLNAVLYTVVVEELADNYFNSQGEYAPQYGIMGAFCTFYDYCIVSSELTEKITKDKTELEIVNILASDDDFINDFNNAIIAPTTRRLDFANAYWDAMAIVECKKSSMNQLVNMLKKSLEGIIDKITPVLTEENLKTANSIASNMAKNKNLPKSIIEEYIKSGRVSEIVNASKAETSNN